MESGSRILWTDHALIELADTYEYLEINFTKKELKALSNEIEKVLKLILKTPNLFPVSKTKGVRKVVVKKYNTMYYREHKDYIEILSFFSNRQNPNKRKN